MSIFPYVKLKHETYFAACHEATQRVATSALSIAEYLDRWQQRSLGRRRQYAHRTKLHQWLLRQNFIHEGFRNSRQRSRIDSGLFLQAQTSILDRLFNIHQKHMAPGTPHTISGFQNCADEVLRHYTDGTAAMAAFKARYPRTFRRENTYEALKENMNDSAPRALRAISRTNEDMRWLRNILRCPYTP